jgi:hypothetical protein
MYVAHANTHTHPQITNTQSQSQQHVQILDPLTLLVDGRPLDRTHIAPARVRLEAFDG